jgi:hypothetical protein
MIQDKWLTIRFNKEHAQDGYDVKRPAERASETVAVSSAPPKRLSSYFLPWRRAAAPFALLSVVLFSGTAHGQLPTTTALPYLLTNDGLTKAVVIQTVSVIPVPPAVASSNIGTLLGGGLSAALTVGIGPTTEAAAAAVAIASARKIQSLKNLNAANKVRQEMQQDAQQGEAADEAQLNQTCPLPNAIKPNAIKSVRYLRAKASRQLRANARQLRANARGQLRANDASLCSTQEDQADVAEEQLEELTEVGNATQEAIEGAEAAAEAAEVAAEVAEEAAEAAEIGIDILQSLLDALSLF